MKRLHVSVTVDDIDKSVEFYKELFGAEPSVRKPDYAKWMLDEPSVNFALSHCGSEKGVGHLGIQVDRDDELAELFERVERAGGAALTENRTTCCYAESTKQWIDDPNGVRWEAFLTHRVSGKIDAVTSID